MKGIHVLSICPGPVHGNMPREILGDSLNKVVEDSFNAV